MRWMLPLCAAVVFAACGDDPVSRAVGARCDLAAECDERCLGPGGDWPGGFCTVSCDTSDDCPGEAACVANEGGVCLFVCAIDADCAFLGTGWGCVELDRKPTGVVKACRGN
ncbi:MAG: hypothetical protein K8W52_41995 [Deltaproteobacteria bacterium]|nr:hypothetical protein [Deltaproteobacteria bacterium]